MTAMKFLAYAHALVWTACFCRATSDQWTTVNHDAISEDMKLQPPVTWLSKYGAQTDMPFSGPLSFSHLPYDRCLENTTAAFDIAIVGFPFDTAVSNRPGARFGPFAIRSGSRRQRPGRGYTLSWGMDPYAINSSTVIIDCGDVPLNPFDNIVALDQMEVAYSTLLHRPMVSSGTSIKNAVIGLDGEYHPRILTLGGDHSIVLGILRSLYKVYGPISVIHFDAHLDTWTYIPLEGVNSYPDSERSKFTHGSFFSMAYEEGLMSNNSIHAGIRCKMQGVEDMSHDLKTGFEYITSDDIDDYSIAAVIDKIRRRVGDRPVYLSLDIDVIDPGFAPATGTPEAAGWTPREVKRIIRGLTGLKFVGADIVEVAPSYDHAEVTGILAADIAHDFLSMFMSEKPPNANRPD